VPAADPNGNNEAAIARYGEMRQADAPLTRVCRTGMADRAKAKMTVAPNTCIRRLAMTGGE